MEFKNNELVIVIHFGELWLKGRNRNQYIRKLEDNIREQLAGESFLLERHYDRLLLRMDKKSELISIRGKISRTFGISCFEAATVVKPRLGSITATAKRILSASPRPKSLRIDAHRSYKQLPFNSLEIISKIKGVAEKLGIDPTTKGYEKELRVSVTKEAAFLSLGREKGLGGLPVGSSGKGVILLSGGIDSPVAAWYAMKRGIEPVYVHIHAFQNPQEAIEGKVTRMITHLSAFYPHYRAYFAPSHVFQAAALKAGRYELVLLKAFMLRLAERVAEKEDASVVFTGESLGQVASQTPENLSAEEYGVKLPVLRPLIGYDKEEIIRVAKMIGTYEESIKKYRDVCSLNARNPKLNSKKEKVDELLKKMGIRNIVSRSLKESKIISNSK